MIPAAIMLVSGILNASDAAMAFGFGDIILPAFPPPIMASNIAVLLIPALCAMASAIGATVMTATSTNTPTAVKIIVAAANASNALVSPSFFTIVSAMTDAAPDSISTPARTPAAKIRRTAGMMPLAPSIIKVTVSVILTPPTRPPIKAPAIMP
ncbi:Uncharacterised protein [Mycobacteroides abscessus subsp. abscessus]|nr:Uncharacterised protein [Mycobacteroides abscessus subsp. abscessus]